MGNTQILRAGLHDSGVPLVFCGGGCGEMLRLGEADISIRTQMGWGAPVCPTCRLIAQMENVASMLLRWDAKLDARTNPWGYE